MISEISVLVALRAYSSGFPSSAVMVQALAGMAERRPEVLHLVVAWPAAVLHPGWFG